MIVVADRETFNNWVTFRNKVVNIAFSYNYPRFSLDEGLSESAVSGKEDFVYGVLSNYVEAQAIVDVIGANAFKKMIENLWNKDIFRRSIQRNTKVSSMLRGFKWTVSPQGFSYWSNIERKLMEVGL